MTSPEPPGDGYILAYHSHRDLILEHSQTHGCDPVPILGLWVLLGGSEVDPSWQIPLTLLPRPMKLWAHFGDNPPPDMPPPTYRTGELPERYDEPAACLAAIGFLSSLAEAIYPEAF